MHFNTSQLDKQTKLALLLDAKDLATSVVLHELEVEKSPHRMQTDKTFSDIMTLLQNNKIHFFVSKRFNHLENEFYGEVSAATLLPLDTNYFIFTYLKAEDIDSLLKKYSLI
jgi:hypothetical protein